MTATMTSLEKAEQAADKAREKAAELREQHRAAEARDKAARDVAEEKFWAQRRADYVKHYGGRIQAAHDAFVDAVRTGGDVHGAWVEYRRTRVVVADEFRAWAHQHAKAHDDKLDAKRAQLGRLNTLAGFIQTTPRPRGAQWQAEVEEWRRLAADYLGTDPGQPRPLANDLPLPKLGRLSGLGGPDPDEDADFNQAFTAVVRQVEAEAVAEHQAKRDAELLAAQDQASGRA